ncbi:phosphoadenylyl-sulfate reductase [Camelimonas abortus]|uniref:Adenosine 5'-phosphosulfate reductase n=1 Tax=Camelimonas abortus TaxID=1017184 RepID=A0ABV7LBC1_9HYPH
MLRQHDPSVTCDPAALARAAAELDARFAGASARDVLRAVLLDGVAGEVALVSSFGAESAALLHLAAGVRRDAPVLFVDTRRLFPETLAYRDRLVELLGLTNVITIGPDAGTEQRLDPIGAMFARDPDACCAFRKVEPLEAALRPYRAWISGRKRYQAASRHDIPLFEATETHIKVNPLASWSMADVAAWMREHGLPAHPLVAKGYPSIGCAPCTTPVAEGEDPRAGRWRGTGKTECGIHVSKSSKLSGSIRA